MYRDQGRGTNEGRGGDVVTDDDGAYRPASMSTFAPAVTPGPSVVHTQTNARPASTTAGEPPGSPLHVTVPDFIAPENVADYLKGWAAGRQAAGQGPLPDEVAHDVVLILDAADATTLGLKTAG